jgi:hypoxanthine phosphoribosyltransferase
MAGREKTASHTPLPISAGQINRRIDELGEQIDRFCDGRELTVLVVLTGGIMFASDLVRRLSGPVRLETAGLRSYRGADTKPGTLQYTHPLPANLHGRNVLIVDDILDTGRTLARLMDDVRRVAAAEVRAAVLLRKDRPDVPQRPSVDWVGFEIADRFVAGYGLDYDGLYRNCPEVFVPDTSPGGRP